MNERENLNPYEPPRQIEDDPSPEIVETVDAKGCAWLALQIVGAPLLLLACCTFGLTAFCLLLAIIATPIVLIYEEYSLRDVLRGIVAFSVILAIFVSMLFYLYSRHLVYIKQRSGYKLMAIISVIWLLGAASLPLFIPFESGFPEAIGPLFIGFCMLLTAIQLGLCIFIYYNKKSEPERPPTDSPEYVE